MRAFLDGRITQLCAAGLLIVALTRWPYGFYIFLRIAICLSALLLTWRSLQSKRKLWTAVMIGVAILFNPLIPIYLKRHSWAVIDLLIAAIFLMCPPEKKSTLP
ncbi:DUF6804 family protein [Burkholderia ubonensis]